MPKDNRDVNISGIRKISDDLLFAVDIPAVSPETMSELVEDSLRHTKPKPLVRDSAGFGDIVALGADAFIAAKLVIEAVVVLIHIEGIRRWIDARGTSQRSSSEALAELSVSDRNALAIEIEARVAILGRSSEAERRSELYDRLTELTHRIREG